MKHRAMASHRRTAVAGNRNCRKTILYIFFHKTCKDLSYFNLLWIRKLEIKLVSICKLHSAHPF